MSEAIKAAVAELEATLAEKRKDIEQLEATIKQLQKWYGLSEGETAEEEVQEINWRNIYEEWLRLEKPPMSGFATEMKVNYGTLRRYFRGFEGEGIQEPAETEEAEPPAENDVMAEWKPGGRATNDTVGALYRKWLELGKPALDVFAKRDDVRLSNSTIFRVAKKHSWPKPAEDTRQTRHAKPDQEAEPERGVGRAPLISDEEAAALHKDWVAAGKPKLKAFARTLGVTHDAIRRCAERNNWGRAAMVSDEKPKPNMSRIREALARIKGKGKGAQAIDPLDGDEKVL